MLRATEVGIAKQTFREDRKIHSFRFHPMTQQQIADAWGVSDSMVWLIERRAIKKLRAAILRDPVLRTLAAESGCKIEGRGVKSA